MNKIEPSTVSRILSNWRLEEAVIENMLFMVSLEKSGVQYVFIRELKGKYAIRKVYPKLIKRLNSDELWELRTRNLELPMEVSDVDDDDCDNDD